jgi:hypothetical protein
MGELLTQRAIVMGEQVTNWSLRSVLAGDSGPAWNPDFA